LRHPLILPFHFQLINITDLDGIHGDERQLGDLVNMKETTVFTLPSNMLCFGQGEAAVSTVDGRVICTVGCGDGELYIRDRIVIRDEAGNPMCCLVHGAQYGIQTGTYFIHAYKPYFKGQTPILGTKQDGNVLYSWAKVTAQGVGAVGIDLAKATPDRPNDVFNKTRKMAKQFDLKAAPVGHGASAQVQIANKEGFVVGLVCTQDGEANCRTVVASPGTDPVLVLAIAILQQKPKPVLLDGSLALPPNAKARVMPRPHYSYATTS